MSKSEGFTMPLSEDGNTVLCVGSMFAVVATGVVILVALYNSCESYDCPTEPKQNVLVPSEEVDSPKPSL